jgi:hypothetical protein
LRVLPGQNPGTLNATPTLSGSGIARSWQLSLPQPCLRAIPMGWPSFFAQFLSHFAMHFNLGWTKKEIQPIRVLCIK